MSLPTLEDYNEAAQNPQIAFADPELKHGSVRSTTLGMPRPVCGGFALTYTITTTSGKYAVRCFHREQPYREQRYAAIHKKLGELKSGYFVDFKFQPEGIRIRGQGYPVVKMAWAQGETLGEFVNANYRKKDVLGNLKASLSGLSSFLEKNRLAHGDIQPGNLMVANNGKSIQLIDYDGMYMPELASLGANEIGHKNFQHPEREVVIPWNDKTDRFAFILLDVTLDALMAQPALWQDTQSDGDKFVLGANDFIAPASSPVFSKLSQIAPIRDKASKFSAICSNDYDDIPSLADFLNGSIQIISSAVVESAPTGYISTYPVLDATNFAECLRHVGDIVELVGTITGVKYSQTKKGKRPYYFLNFSDWRGNAVKLTAWSDYIEKNPDLDFEKLMGKTVSVIGLLQPPYEGRYYDKTYTSISIFLDSRINIISRKEADYRLKYEKNPPRRKKTSRKQPAQSKSRSSNREIFSRAASASTSSPKSSQKPATSPGSATKSSSNRNTLNEITSKFNSGRSGTSTRPTPGQATFTAWKSQPWLARCPLCGHENQVGFSGARQYVCAACGALEEYDHKSNLITILSATSSQPYSPPPHKSIAKQAPSSSGNQTNPAPQKSVPPSRPQKRGCLYSLASILLTLLFIISGLFTLFN